MSALPIFDGSPSAWIVVSGLIFAATGLVSCGLRIASPPLSLLGGIVAGAALLWSSNAAFAQDDLAEIVRKAEARGRAAEAALKDWASEVASRSELYAADAKALATGNAAQLQRGMAYLDTQSLAPGVGDEHLSAEQGVVYVAVSFSMDRTALRSLAAEARRAGAVLVIRGFVGGSVPKTVAASRSVFDENTAAGLAIDPQVFRAFDIKRAPTFIAAQAPVEPCEGEVTCSSRPTIHDKLSGNISLEEALRLLSRGKDGGRVARRALARMEP